MYGILSDYEDLTNKYLNKEITFQEYSKLVEQRSKELENKKINIIDAVNCKIITNN